MKITKLVAAVAIALIAFSGFADAQHGKFKVEEINQANRYFGQLNLSPVEGNAYSISSGMGVESGADATDQGQFLNLGVDPNTGALNDAIMNDQATVIGTDLADVFGAAAANEAIAYECLESMGMDAATGRFILELTVGVKVTGTELQWDTLVLDLQDPLDIGFDADGDGTITLAEGAGDGITGKGPDGVYGTMDDVEAPDGFTDTGDGTLDAPFPLDPTGLVFLLDLDGDMDNTNDPPSPAVSQGFFVGANLGGTNISFDPAAGQVDVTAAVWELLTDDMSNADIDGDGVGDGPFDVSAFAVFNPVLGGGWQGDFGVGFAEDEIACTTMETVHGNTRMNQLRVTYLSDIENEFCFSMGGPVLCGDVNLDGVVNLLDVAPFVNLITTGTFQAEGDTDGNGVVNLLDVAGFVDKLTGG